MTVNGASADRYGDFTFAGTNNSLVDGNNAFAMIARNVYGSAVTNNLSVSLPANIALLCDLNGNLTNDGLRSFSYDAENQLTNVSVANQWKAEFVYDGFGRRRITKDYGWNGSGWTKTNETRLICDGPLPIQERDSNNNPLVTYTRGIDFSASISGMGGIGGLLARTDAGTSAFYHSDGSGNITALMIGTGEVAARYQYNPFGRLSGIWGTLASANMMRFSSKPMHLLSGMYDYGARWYPPELERWLNPDPLGELGGINLHAFIDNDPVNLVDPFGLEDTKPSLLGGIGRDLATVAIDWAMSGDFRANPDVQVEERTAKLGPTKNILPEVAADTGELVGNVTEEIAKQYAYAKIAGILFGIRIKCKDLVKLERYGSQVEAKAAQEANKLSPRPGHTTQPKWIGKEGTVDPRTLGKPANYTHKMDIYADKRVVKWLEKNAITKPNEPGRWGIPADKLDEFNDLVKKIVSSPR